MAMLIQTHVRQARHRHRHEPAGGLPRAFPAPVSIGLWIQAEVIAMATDLAEFIGAALGLNLLFGIPLLRAGVHHRRFAFGILALQRAAASGTLEAAIVVPGRDHRGRLRLPDLACPARSGVDRPRPVRARFAGTESVLLAAGILGATVMPHVIYLHSALTQRRVVGANDAERRKIFRFERIDVIIAMVHRRAGQHVDADRRRRLFHASGLTGVDSIEGAYAASDAWSAITRDAVFGFALLASGLSSSSVGTMAGQVVMQGFMQRRSRCSCGARSRWRPALMVLAIGVDPTRALVLSQVVLSFGIPFALIPLVLFCATARADGGARQPPADDRGRGARRHGDRLAQRLPARADDLGIAARLSPCRSRSPNPPRGM